MGFSRPPTHRYFWAKKVESDSRAASDNFGHLLITSKNSLDLN